MLSFLRDKSIEGEFTNFYLDSVGQVTVGIGHMIPDKDKFLELSHYLHIKDNPKLPATEEQIEREWQRMQSLKVRYVGAYKYHTAGSYKKDAIVEVDQERIVVETKKILLKMIAEMQHRYKTIIGAPYPAQKGLLDLVYNVGIPRLKKFIQFNQAVANEDWKAAAEHCHRKGIGEYRNRCVREFFLQAAREVERGVPESEIIASTNQLSITPHQTPSAKSPVHAQPKKTKNTLGKLLQNKKTNGHSRIPVPTGTLAPHGKSLLPHVVHENISADTEMLGKAYLQLAVPISDKFIVTSFSGDEGMSELFCYHIVAYSKNHDIAGNDLLSKSVTLQINDKHKIRYFNGDVYAFSAGEIQGGFRQYTLELRPRLWFLSHASNSRIFHNMSTKEIVKKICEEFHISVDVSRLYHPLKPRSYCVQYSETTLNFIQRLLEEEGVFYFFRHEKDKHTLVLADDWIVYKSIPFTRLVEIKDCYHNYSACVSKFAQMDYHHEAPSKKLDVSHLASKIILDKKYECRQSFGGYKEQAVGELLVKKRLETEQMDHEWIIAHGNSSELQPAYKVQIKNENFVVVRMQHYATDRWHAKGKIKETVEHYSSQIICIPANKTYRPPRVTPRPQIYGTLSAHVVGTGESDQEVAVNQCGSVLVRFPWDREKNSSCRVRVAQVASGDKHGCVFHPRIGDEVVVIFEEGDPDRPLIQASQRNAESMPPYELASHHTQSGIKTKTVNGSGQNEILFEDKNGAEEIYIHAQKDYLRVVEANESVTINKGDQVIKVVSGKSICEAANAIEFKVATNSVLINQEGIFINGQEVNINN